ncbi:variable surface protein, partial [Plasmodium gonderi]
MVKIIIFLNYYNCNNIDGNYSDIFNANIKEICCKSLAYLKEAYGEHHESLYKIGFKYLYYWLYKHKFKSDKVSSDFKVIYNEIIKIFNENYRGLSYLTHYQSNVHNDFCNDIKTIIDTYNPQASIKQSEKCISKEL